MKKCKIFNKIRKYINFEKDEDTIFGSNKSMYAVESIVGSTFQLNKNQTEYYLNLSKKISKISSIQQRRLSFRPKLELPNTINPKKNEPILDERQWEKLQLEILRYLKKICISVFLWAKKNSFSNSTGYFEFENPDIDQKFGLIYHLGYFHPQFMRECISHEFLNLNENPLNLFMNGNHSFDKNIIFKYYTQFIYNIYFKNWGLRESADNIDQLDDMIQNSESKL